MRTLCDACESAAAIVFCAADEAALCRSCDEKVCFSKSMSQILKKFTAFFFFFFSLFGCKFANRTRVSFCIVELDVDSVHIFLSFLTC